MSATSAPSRLRSDYRRDGFVIVRGLFDPEAIAAAAA